MGVTLDLARGEELEQWLVVASKGLADESRQRVAKEIVSHYCDALEDGVSRGNPLDQVHGAAMENLGNPDKANRAYRRTYLTVRDEKRLNSLESTLAISPRQAKRLLFLVLILVVCVTLMMLPDLAQTIQSSHHVRCGIHQSAIEIKQYAADCGPGQHQLFSRLAM